MPQSLIKGIQEQQQNEVKSSCMEKKEIFEKENLQRSFKQYHQIEYLHESNEGLVTANKRLRENLECAKIIENYALFFLFWVIEIEYRP